MKQKKKRRADPLFWYKTGAASAALGLVALWGFWFYSTSMVTDSGNINVTGIRANNKIYSYSVFGDFYFRQIRYDEEGQSTTDYSELIPVRTNVGYDFDGASPQIVLKTEETGAAPIVISGGGASFTSDEKRILRSLRYSFSQEYGRMLAAQDQMILDQAREATMRIQREIFGSAVDLPRTKVEHFREDPKDVSASALPIDNIRFDVFELDLVSRNLQSFQVCPSGKWCKNIWSVSFNEADHIYFQYLDQYSGANIDDLVDDGQRKGLWQESLLVKLVKPTDDGVEPIFFQADVKSNKLRSYFMDRNGYAYVLVMAVQNDEMLAEGLADFLKISYGIRFVDTIGFRNGFATMQKELLASAGEFLAGVMLNRKRYLALFEDGALGGIEAAFRNDLGERDFKLVFGDMASDDGFDWVKLAFSSLYAADLLGLTQANDQASNGEGLAQNDSAAPMRFEDVDAFEERYGDLNDPESRGESLLRATTLLEAYTAEIFAAIDGIKKSRSGFRWLADPKRELGERCKDRRCLQELASISQG
jgi:hypothetical protein